MSILLPMRYWFASLTVGGHKIESLAWRFSHASCVAITCSKFQAQQQQGWATPSPTPKLPQETAEGKVGAGVLPLLAVPLTVCGA